VLQDGSGRYHFNTLLRRISLIERNYKVGVLALSANILSDNLYGAKTSQRKSYSLENLSHDCSDLVQTCCDDHALVRFCLANFYFMRMYPCSAEVSYFTIAILSNETNKK
jgi:hypothetical protein